MVATRMHHFVFALGACLFAAGCGSTENASGGSGGVSGSTAITSTSGGANSSAGGAGTGGASCALPASTVRPHPGEYDYKSCMDCHGETYWGGWVYANAAGDAWVSQATVTLTATDGGASIPMLSAKDGFFHLNRAEVAVPSSFTPCVAKCSDRVCATTVHKSADCQTAECHGTSGRLIYVNDGTRRGTGGSGSTGTNCVAATSGGPRMHDPEFDLQTCATCHDPSYIGGYVYDGIVSDTPVAMATLTLTPDKGEPITAVTGPGGMFQIVGKLSAPYRVCVSKCPQTRCSSAASHPNTDDCVTCHDEKQRIYLK